MDAEIEMVPETVELAAGDTMLAVVACAVEALSRAVKKKSATQSRATGKGR